MKPSEYTALDGVALADLVASRQVTAAELAATARAAIDEVNPRLNAVISGRLTDMGPACHSRVTVV